MKNKIKVHDGIVGALILTSVLLTLNQDPAWIYLAGAVSVLMLISSVTGFCPVYFILNKIMPNADDSCCTKK